MQQRLAKIARELNVASTTLVEHLASKGLQLDSSPNPKVPSEWHEMLLEDFGEIQAVKEKADQMSIGTRPALTKEAKKSTKAFIPKSRRKSTPADTPVAETTEEVEAKTSPEIESIVTPEPETVVAPEVEQPVTEDEVVSNKSKVGIKVVDKIQLNKKAQKEEKANVEEEEEEQPEEEVVEKVEVEEDGVSAGDAHEVEEKEESEKEKPRKKKNKEEDKEEEEEFVRTKTPQLRGLKIKGKIDKEKLEKRQRKPEPKEDKEEKPKRRGKRRRIRKRVSGRRPDRQDRGQRRKKEDEVKEISSKEIEEKLKSTLARIKGKSGGGRRRKDRRERREEIRQKQQSEQLEEGEDKILNITEFVSVQELANLMNVSISDVITTCLNLGVVVSINQRIDAEVIELVAGEFGFEVKFTDAEEAEIEEEEIEDDPEDLKPRAPIVTVMGHVDHGKTSLLDYIREAKVAEGEAGGITQHIGAYEVRVGEDDKKVTFLDTPGHEAFTAMRARGAKVTDIAVIIVAADDKIMPQTKEAISHAQAAGVPIIFAINKIDKEGADPDRIKRELSEMNFLVEEWGGKYQSQDISAKTGKNIDLLLEKIVLEAELLELKANPDRKAIGTVIEASLDKGRGYVCKMLVQTGNLQVGDPVVSGEHSGRVRAMFNERGKKVKKAGPSAPVLILGLSGAPQAGEPFKVLDSEQEARQQAARRAQISREQANRASKRISLEEIGRRLALGTFKELNLIVKADVDGSAEALADSLIKQSQETVQVNVIHKAVGQIIESDILLASASDAIIIGFQVRPSLGARKLAETEGVEIKTYSIIYEAIDEVRMAIEGMLEPTEEEKITAQLEVRETYKISRIGTVAGCYVEDGKINRNDYVRIIREGIVVYPAKEKTNAEIDSLKRFKDDVKEVRSGMECGVTIKNFNDIKVGDTIEAYQIIQVKQTLDS